MSSSLKIAALDRERALQGEVKEWQAQWREERKLHTKLKGEAGVVEWFDLAWYLTVFFYEGNLYLEGVEYHLDGSVPDYGNSSALVMELPQSCAERLMCSILKIVQC